MSRGAAQPGAGLALLSAMPIAPRVPWSPAAAALAVLAVLGSACASDIDDGGQGATVDGGGGGDVDAHPTPPDAAPSDDSDGGAPDASPPVPGYTLVFETGYDTLDDMLYGGNGQYGDGTISTTVYKTGPGSFYSRPANVSAGTRSEVQYSGALQNPEEGAIEYDVRYEVVVPNNGHSLQWHPETAGGSASPGLWHIDGKFNVMRWKDGGLYEQPGPLKTIELDRWYHMRVEYKFAEAPNGYIRWYIDGALYYDVPSGTSNGWLGDGSGQYLKVGYNGWDDDSTDSRIYYDNLKIYRKD